MFKNKFDQEIDRVSNVFTLLSDRNRLSIFAILTYGEITVSQIYKCLELCQNLIAHHLRVLKDYGFVTSKKVGRKVYYSLNPNEVDNLKQIINKITRKTII